MQGCELASEVTIPRGGLIRWAGPSKTGGYAPARLDGLRLLHIEKFIGTYLAGFMSGHPCIGARSLASERTGFYYAVYRDMRSVETAISVLDDIETYYKHSDDACGPVLKSFICIFAEVVESPEQFANLFWPFMQTVHDIDCLTHDYDAAVSSDPSSEAFELSFRGRAAFPTSLHPASQRTARRYAYPGWALNQSAQFNELRARGEFDDWKRKIRTVDAKFDPSGTSNPLLADHGEGSPGAQLGGIAMERYPFIARTADERPAVANTLITRAISEGATSTIVDRLHRLAAHHRALPGADAPSTWSSE